MSRRAGSRRPSGRSAARIGLLAAAVVACRPSPPGESSGAGGGQPAPASDRDAPFADATADSGLDFRHWRGATGDFYFPEIMGGGVALVDYDADGDLDVYLVQGSLLAAGETAANTVGPAPAPYPPSDRLYRNDLVPAAGRGGAASARFTDVTAASGIAESEHGMGVAAGDYDHDGYPDLYVTGFSRGRLLHNRGNGTFEDSTVAAGAGDEGWSVSTAFVDFDRDGWLDLFIGRYVDATVANHKVCRASAGYLDYCGPLSYDAVPSRLLRNLGDGTFTDVSAAAGIDARYGPALGVATADFDGDGWIDLYVANDQTANQLWRNQGDGTFADDALLAGCALDLEGRPQASMGVDAADFDGDGDEDLFMTNLDEESNTLYLNDGGGSFRDGTAESGLGPPSVPYTGFGTAWLDYDNDGALDLLVVNGAVTIVEKLAAAGDRNPFHQPDLLFKGDGGGRFADVTAEAGAPFAAPDAGRGAAFGDVDNDGDTDVVIANNGGPARLLRNQAGSRAAWLGARLVGARPGGGPDRDLLGARAELLRDGGRPLVRRSRADGSYASANDPRVLFGLGRPPDEARERVRVTWPDDRIELFPGLAAGRYHTLREGEGVAVAAGDRGGREDEPGAAEPRPRPGGGGDAARVAPPVSPSAGIPHPDLRALEPAVAAQIRALRRDLDEASTTGAEPAAKARAYGELGRAYQAYELFDAAAACYRSAAELDAAESAWVYLGAVVAQRRGRLEEAATLLRRVVDDDPRSLSALLRLGSLELDLGRPDEARAFFDRALEHHPGEPAALYGLGRIAQGEGDWRAARDLYRRTLAAQPEASIVEYALGQTYRELGDDDAARRHLALAGPAPVRFRDDLVASVEALATGSGAHLLAGGRALLIGDHETAERHLRRALELDPGHLEARSSLVRLQLAVADKLARTQKWDQAIARYDAVLELDPAQGEAWMKRATALFLGGRYADAAASLERGLAAAPEDRLLATAAARFYASCPDRALRDGRRALALAERLFGQQQSVENAELVAMAHAESGAFAEAVTWQRRALTAAATAGDSALTEALRRNLDRYVAGESCCAG